MKLGTRGRYSLRLMLAITQLSSGERPVGLQEISGLTRISRRYLEQLAIPLRRAALLSGRAGRSGGYLLARPAEQIRLREIIEASSGPIRLARCIDDASECRRSARCHCRILWTRITHAIRAALDEYTLAELADPEEFLGKVEGGVPEVFLAGVGECAEKSHDRTSHRQSGRPAHVGRHH